MPDLKELDKQKSFLVTMFSKVTMDNAHELMKLIEAPNFIKFGCECNFEGVRYKLDFNFKKVKELNK